MQPKFTSILERSEKAPDLLSRRTWPKPYALTRAQPRCSKKQPRRCEPTFDFCLSLTLIFVGAQNDMVGTASLLSFVR